MSGEKQSNELSEFKNFINRHPKLIREIRKNGESWQGIYEQWILLGEDDIHWEQYKEDQEEKESKESTEKLLSKFDLNPEMLEQVVKYAKTIDIHKLQEYVKQLSHTITTIQEIVDQYQQSKRPSQRMERPFNWFSD